MKIKIKFTLSLSIILIVLALILNILIRQVLISNMEGNITRSLEDIMKSTREYVKYRLMVDESVPDTEKFKQDAVYISKFISLNYECNSYITDMEGNIIDNNEKIKSEDSKRAVAASNGQAVVNLKYEKNDVKGVLSFPLYINSSYLGIVSINKSYTDIFATYNKTVNLITLIEFIVFFIIFILAFFITSKITKPITSLTSAVKQVGEGNYDINLKINSKDEVGVLSNEFMNMKEKINDQIQTIQNEKEKVERLEKVRRDFFNNVTHELKTPLTAISGYAETLLEGIVTDEAFKSRAIERIYSESERLHRLVLELIDVSKGISFDDEKMLPIDIKDLLNDICDDMSIKAKKYSIIIKRDIADGNILGQINRIRELMINIVDNAIKYTVDCDNILVKTYLSDKFYIIDVVNKGEKIPKEVYDNIFEPFVRSTNSKESDSRGLGLYICSEIVKVHNGEISIENGDSIIVKVKIPLVGNNLATS